MNTISLRMSNLVGKRISHFFVGRIARKLGSKTKLDERPYEYKKEIFPLDSPLKGR